MARNNPYKLYGIIGCPIKHTLSPCMHNAAFNKLKMKAVYLPFLVKPDKLKEAMSSFRKSGISGFNVTIPFKSECMRYLDKIESTAKIIGAVNTVAVKKSKFIGYNTDYSGFLRSLKKELKFKPRGKDVFILGAGGAARGVGFALAKERARSIYIYDIIEKKSALVVKSLSKFFSKCRIESCSKGDIADSVKKCTLLINCTPLGMNKNDPLPIAPGLFHNRLKIYDIVYTPLQTKLVKLAKKKGIKAIGGIGMLLYQGIGAFEIWMRKKAPVSLMRKELLKRLKALE